MAYIGLTREAQEEYTKRVAESEKGVQKALDIVEGMDMFVIPESEFTPEFYDRPSGPIRMKVISHDPDEPGLHRKWLRKDYRWMMKEGVDMLRSFREGDEIIITNSQMTADLVHAGLEFSGAVGRELVRQQIKSYTARFAIGKKIKFVAKRMDCFRVFLCMTFEGDPEEGMWNLEIPKLAGFCFIEPDSPELSITECPDEYLHETELVLKGLIEQNEVSGWTQEEAEQYLKPVADAMTKYGICFYRP